MTSLHAGGWRGNPLTERLRFDVPQIEVRAIAYVTSCDLVHFTCIHTRETPVQSNRCDKLLNNSGIIGETGKSNAPCFVPASTKHWRIAAIANLLWLILNIRRLVMSDG